MRRGSIVVMVLALMIVSLPAHADPAASVIVDLRSGEQVRGTFPAETLTLKTPGGVTEVPVKEVSHIMFNNKYVGKLDSKGNPDDNETVYLLSGKILVGMIAGETFTVMGEEINHVSLLAVTFPDLYHTRKNADYVLPAPPPPKKEEKPLKDDESLLGEKKAQPDGREEEIDPAAKSAWDAESDDDVTINIGTPAAPPHTIRVESGPDLIPASGNGVNPQEGESTGGTPQ